jgi:serine/threonine-protein kinase
VGQTPQRGLRLKPGRHEVRVVNEELGFGRTLNVQVRRGAEVSRHFAFGQGRVALQVEPWANVYLRSRLLGQTPMAPITLYEGRHTLRLVNPDLGKEKTVVVNIVAGATINLPVRMGD